MKTSFKLKPQKVGQRMVNAGQLKHVHIVGQMVKDVTRNKQIVDDVADAVSKGRKVMIVSERRTHLEKLREMIMLTLYQYDLKFEPTCDYYVGQRSEVELKIAERANVILATKQMIEEGLDIPAIDVILLAVPMSDVEQTVGRVRRHCLAKESKCNHLCPWRAGTCQKKPDPIVVDITDGLVPRAARKWPRRREFYTKIGAL